MPDTRKNIDVLIFKYLQQTITEEELQQLDHWISLSDENRRKFRQLTDEQYISNELDKLYRYDESKGWNRIKEHFPSSTQSKVKNIHNPESVKGLRLWPRIAAAAIVILIVGSVYFFYRATLQPANEMRMANNRSVVENDVLPGSNKAILTLADGSVIELDDSATDTLARQGNTRVLNMKGKLAYMPSQKNTGEVLYNTITTPAGGKYQIVLPDGTSVWLNAASSIRFPTSFNGTERNVTITGEAYFEVAHNKRMPFRLTVNGSEVKVLGTRFDVMAYGDEAALEVTLLEGSVNFVKDDMQTVLKPGEQSRLTKNGQIHLLKDVDLDKIMAWKNGSFYFDNADLETVMRQLSRWYDVDVVYKRTNTGDLFHADIPMNMKLSEVLKALEIAGGLQFDIQGKKIIVM